MCFGKLSAHPIGPSRFFAAKAAPTNVPVFCRSGFNRDQPTNGQIGKSSYSVSFKNRGQTEPQTTIKYKFVTLLVLVLTSKLHYHFRYCNIINNLDCPVF